MRMAARGSPEFLDYFARELHYIREGGAEFAKNYPKVAARLNIAGHHCGDPHVERLIESFAYLTAKLQHHIDSELPELTSALLGVLYPQYASPIPSMAIASMVLPKGAKPTSAAVIPKLTPLFAEASGGPTCRFRTCYPVELWPITVKGADVVAPETLDITTSDKDKQKPVAALRIKLETAEIPFRKLAEEGDPKHRLRRLRFFMNGDNTAMSQLYDLLFASAGKVLITGGDRSGVLSEGALRPVGFADDEDALPYPTHAHSGYRIIQEYFAFPDKFHFFDIEFGLLPAGRTCDIVILLGQRPPASVGIRNTTFMLGCTPIINLFTKITEPIRVDHRRPEYRLVPDARRERTTEIHSIKDVTATAPVDAKTATYEPFFSYAHRARGEEPTAFWHARRVPSERKEIPGTDVYLSFVDLDFKPQRPPSEAVYATVLCTNRDLASEMSPNVKLELERSGPPVSVTCHTTPTQQQHVPLGGQALWRLVSNLSLNHLSLSAGGSGRNALREILRSYLFADSPQADRQIASIEEMSSEIVTRRVSGSAWRGFCRGTEITMTVDEDKLKGSSAILLGSVLSRFFSLYAHINSFTELVLRSESRQEEWKRWPPTAGEKALL
jgi:type VI secretion system protein ImpG